MEKDNKIRILYTSQHCCIRVVKIARALVKTGKYDIHFLAAQVSWGSQYADKLSFYHSKKQFRNLVLDTDFDVAIHANEPCWQISYIRKLKPDAKIILDAHDLDSVRQGAIPIEEHQALTNCDGVLFVSEEMETFIKDLHRDQLKDKPTAVVEHYCNEEFVDVKMPSPDQRQGLVYEGGAQSPPYKNKQFRYRHLYNIFKQLVDQGHELHLMTGNPDATRTHANIGAYTYGPEVYPKLMKKMLTKRWGLVVFNNADHSQMQVNLTRTNKEQEYLACGLPLIVHGAPATEKWVKEHNVGLCFDKVEDITPEILNQEYPRVKAEVDKLRPTLTMEKHIHKVDDLIQKVLDR